MPLKLQQLNNVLLLHSVVVVHRSLLQLLIRLEVRISDYLLQLRVADLLRTILLHGLFIFVYNLAHVGNTLYTIQAFVERKSGNLLCLIAFISSADGIKLADLWPSFHLKQARNDECLR